MLADWDEAKLPNGKDKFFSVGFISSKGEYRYIKRGVKAGLKRNMKDNDLKAVKPVDKDGFEIAHIYPVWIHAILFFSGNVEMNLFDNG